LCANQNVVTEVNLAFLFSRRGQVHPFAPACGSP